ncbi:MAG: hypothetical protein ACI9TV_000789 [Sulfurimonas sp.]|jgi:hypothetical protein|uniref:hypothetical protein n=1 Tax=Sulfurimonas sp. TaxID=2022749 RepID=UPI0039E24461
MIQLKQLILILLLLSSVYAEEKKVYFYTTEINIKDFKLLKINFDQYLQYFGDYNFQAFNNKETFEEYLKDENIVVILSSWHYKQIAKKYNLQVRLVALKKESITDTKVLIGKKGSSYTGTLTTPFPHEYTTAHINKLTLNSSLDILKVPKEIDALMSVGFGMSQFALVSKDSFELLKKANSFLASQMKIFAESTPTLRMLVASKIKKHHDKEFIEVFTTMDSRDEGKKVLDMLGIDKIVILTKNDLQELGGVK